MTDKELIKEEIEKQIDYAEDDTRYTESYREGLIAAYQTIKAFINALPEESASEDLEEEMIKWHKEHFGNKRDWNKTSGEYLTRKSQLDIARHFAEWQEKKMLGIAEAFYQQGRYEQKQEMMKDVVDGEYWIGEIHLDTPIIQGYDDGDRIKFIPIKTEQQ